MSSSVAPLPNGGGIAVVAEHRGQRGRDEADRREQNFGDSREERHPPAPPSPGVEAAAPISDAEPVPAETLFAATLLANTAPYPPSAAELRLRGPQEWAPPESLLRLKDKLI